MHLLNVLHYFFIMLFLDLHSMSPLQPKTASCCYLHSCWRFPTSRRAMQATRCLGEIISKYISTSIACNQKEDIIFYPIILMLILIKTKIYFLLPLICKINSNNCQNIYIDLSSISKMRKPFLLPPYPQKK